MKHPLSELQLICVQSLSDGLTLEQIAEETDRNLDKIVEVYGTLCDIFSAVNEEHLVAMAFRSGNID